MSNAEAEAAKAKGNQLFKEGKLDEAIDAFAEAIALDGSNRVYYSNRAMALTEAGRLEDAVADADRCIAADPKWPKGYSRKGVALFRQGRLEDAAEAYEAGIAAVGQDANLARGLADTQAAIQRQAASNPLAAIFSDGMWDTLRKDPKCSQLIQDPEVEAALRAIQADPNSPMEKHMSNPGVATCLQTLIAQAFGQPTPQQQQEEMEARARADAAREERARQQEIERKEAEAKAAADAEAARVAAMSPEEKEALKKKEGAVALKQKGNELFKKRKFDEAMAMYNQAVEADPTNASFINNRAAVLMMQKRYEDVVAECDRAAEVCRENMGGYETLAKALSRKGSALFKLGRLDEAEEALDKSLLENFDSKVERVRKDVRKEKQRRQAENYVDPALSDKHKDLGDAAVKENRFPDAIREYTEALKRNPDNLKARSNRSLAYTKLMDWRGALDDCDAVLKVDPKHAKAYLRKIKVLKFLRQYLEAIDIAQIARAALPDNQEVVGALNEVLQSMLSASEEDLRPLMKDPSVASAIQELQGGDQAKVRSILSDPILGAKIQALINAGVLKTN